jgi:hypothetical protein
LLKVVTTLKLSKNIRKRLKVDTVSTPKVLKVDTVSTPKVLKVDTVSTRKVLKVDTPQIKIFPFPVSTNPR